MKMSNKLHKLVGETKEMKVLRYFLILSIAILGFSYVDAKAQDYSGSNQQTVQDIGQTVFKRIIKLNEYGVFDHIAYEVNGGTVTLSGKIFTLGLKKRAEQAVRDIPGVTNIVNNIEYASPSGFDNSIRYGIVRSFANDGGSLYRYLQTPRPSIRIVVDGGHVTLEGYVAYRADANLANILANGVPGVFSVTNNLIVGKEAK